MGSRVRFDAEHIFEVFVEIGKPAGAEKAFVLQKYPENFDEKDVLENLPKFAFPCLTDGQNVDHFTFVLTDIDSKFKFGFCRHATRALTCLCIVSCLPWYEVFYKLLNNLAEVLNRQDSMSITPLLERLYTQKVPQPGELAEVITADLKPKFSFTSPDPKHLPTIPESRNLTEYFNAVDSNNMMVLFASMLFERRVLIVSKKLSRLTACVHGAALLLYPMFWQHLYIPVLPAHLIDYCSAPMPYLIGIHTSLYQKLNKQELGDAVILDADRNAVTSEFDDLEHIPSEVVSSLKKKLKGQADNSLMGDGLARTFLKAMVVLIGGYRDALRFRPNEQISFDPDAFLQSRPHHMKQFLDSLLHLQIFDQFVNERLDLLNAGVGFTDEFEQECNMLGDKWGTQSRYKEWTHHMKKQGKKGKDKSMEFFSKVKDKSKKAYKNIQSKIDDFKKEDGEEEGSGSSGAVGGGISRNRPQTIPTDVLRRQRPARPPPPNRQTAATPGDDNRGLRRISYEKSRQYKVIDLDNLSGESHAPRVTKRISSIRQSADDTEVLEGSTLQRVSLDLMGDPDIQNIFQKSYSLEDLSLVDEACEAEEDGDEAEEAALGIKEDCIRYGRNRNNREASIRESVSSHQLSFQLGTDDIFSAEPLTASPAHRSETPPARPEAPPMRSETPPTRLDAPPSYLQAPPTMRPVAAPRMSIIKQQLSATSEASEDPAPLINLGNNAKEASDTISKSDSIEFDPLKLSTEKLNKSNSSSHSSVNFTSSGSSSSQESLGLTGLSKRNSLNRKPAFSKQSRPVSVRHRTSPTPQAMDANSIKEARTAFMQTEQTKPTQIHENKRSSSNSALDQFDPLVTGQLAVDGPQQGPSKPVEENLLREWDLHFNSKFNPTPQVPPKPSYASPGPQLGMAHRPVHRPVTNSPFLQQQFLHRPQSPPYGPTTSPNHVPYRPPVVASPPLPSQQLNNNIGNSAAKSDPFGDLFSLETPSSPALPSLLLQQQTSPRLPTPAQRPVSMVTMPSQAPKGWETFD